MLDWLGVHAESVPPEIVRTLDLGGYRWKQLATIADVTPAATATGAGVAC